jgi:hypothetical protein
VHVHCSTSWLPRSSSEPIFQRSRIVPQYVRRCSPTFSAAFIAHLELSVDDADEKNALCQPVPVPEEPADWLRMHLHTARNQLHWAKRQELQDWLRRSRLEAYTGLFQQRSQEADAQWLALQARWQQARVPGMKRMDDLLRGATPPGSGTASPAAETALP